MITSQMGSEGTGPERFGPTTSPNAARAFVWALTGTGGPLYRGCIARYAIATFFSVYTLVVMFRLLKDTWSRLGPLSLELLIPAHKVPKGQYSYFRYTGSLTTPDCAESVIWTVLENTVHLSKQQLSAFSDLMFGNGSTMVETFRPVQPLNNRRQLV
ncbi:hypothetical protein P4O66_003114 [Electrophorus voltai]|uniref:Carbonic anhydrase 4 n=1 Tax=Electrophorus voltai TaxID=2609070 RepID=A0AAD8YU46_9TELE|nr:hypothetical protein P4O66_003114 [Electrophorus voltai]